MRVEEAGPCKEGLVGPSKQSTFSDHSIEGRRLYEGIKGTDGVVMLLVARYEGNVGLRYGGEVIMRQPPSSINQLAAPGRPIAFEMIEKPSRRLLNKNQRSVRTA